MQDDLMKLVEDRVNIEKVHGKVAVTHSGDSNLPVYHFLRKFSILSIET
jgi:hypothetical protein